MIDDSVSVRVLQINFDKLSFAQTQTQGRERFECLESLAKQRGRDDK
jgi:hypothetical protein